MLNGLLVNAYDVKTNNFFPAHLAYQGEYITALPCKEAAGSPYYLSPGWIDLHTHILDGFGLFGTNADDIGYRGGCCMVADAGTIGSYTIEGFRRYVAPTIKTNFRVFLCISPIGVIYHHEYNAMQYLNVQETVNTARAHSDIVCGIKVRIGSEVIRHEGVEPLRLAAQAAKELSLPLMVHVGGLPPTIEDVEPFLKQGDVLTHVFNGRGGDCWQSDGTPSPAVARLIERGVVLDVGHGSGSFSFDVCEGALSHPLPEISLGTDLHSHSRKNFAIDMATTLTKFLGMGMPLSDCIRGVTKVPAQVLRLSDWCESSRLTNATLFSIIETADNYYDCQGQTRRYSKKIVPQGVVLNGSYYEI